MSASTKNPAKNLFKINLLLHKGEQSPIYAKFIKWLLASGRFIVVFVEILVIAAFVFRYKLDTELLDLQEQIEEQIPYLESLKSDEEQIRKIQFQLNTIKQTHSQNPNYSQSLLQLSKLTPKNITLTNITINKAKPLSNATLTISGSSPSSLELSAYLKALKNNSNFSEINLTNISFEGRTTFTIMGNLNNTGGSNN